MAIPADSRWLGTGELEFGETVELSKELLMSATRWAFERTDRNLVSNLQIPPRPSDIYIDEAVNETGDRALIRQYGHTRWVNAALKAPWPLRRFWPRGWKALPLPPGMGDEIERYQREQEQEERRIAKRIGVERPVRRRGRR